MFIEKAECEVILNSREEKTVEVSITIRGKIFSASAPSGKSKGMFEVKDYNERGVVWSKRLANGFLKNLENRNIKILKIDDLKDIEKEIRKFEDVNGILGGNVSYAIESALLKAASYESKKELWMFVYESMDYRKKIKMPMSVGNFIGGGLHSRGINGKKPDFQEFELISQGKSFSESFEKSISAYNYTKRLLKKKRGHLLSKTNDENAFETDMTNEETLDFLTKVANKYDLRIGLDVASSSFIDKNNYYNYKNKKLIRDRVEQIDYMRIISEKYNLLYLEDPLDEDDFSGFKELLARIKERKLDTLVVGDDLTTTNLKRLRRAVRAKSINAIIVKPNQIGSLVEVKQVMEFCKKNNIKTIFSHRSGETMDDALGDFAVGFQADFVKTGAYGPERLIKLKRILDIEKSLNTNI